VIDDFNDDSDVWTAVNVRTRASQTQASV
jgi:hypothetical protein